MIRVKLIRLSNQAAVVSYWDNEIGMTEAKVISINSLPGGLRIGSEADVHDDDIITGTDYGIDWNLLLDQSDNVRHLTNAMRNHGIWTIEDLMKKPQKVHAAIVASAASIYADLIKLAEALV